MTDYKNIPSYHAEQQRQINFFEPVTQQDMSMVKGTTGITNISNGRTSNSNDSNLHSQHKGDHEKSSHQAGNNQQSNERANTSYADKDEITSSTENHVMHNQQGDDDMHEIKAKSYSREIDNESMHEMYEVHDRGMVPQPKILIIGVGGGGCNAVNFMEQQGMENVTLCSANTDAQSLSSVNVDLKIQMGKSRLGAGADPGKGRDAALESINDFKKVLDGKDMVFITAGMGGGTGTGASPVIAQTAKEMGVLAVGVVTLPYSRERGRDVVAEEGVKKLLEQVDCLITIPNDKLVECYGEETSFFDAFKNANRVLYDAVDGITNIVLHTGVMNIDFEDLNTVMNYRGMALMSSGKASGEDCAVKAIEIALNNPLLEHLRVADAKGVVLNITAGNDFTQEQFNQLHDAINSIIAPGATFVSGVVNDPEFKDSVYVTVVATGLDVKNADGLQGGSSSRANITTSSEEQSRPVDDFPLSSRSSFANTAGVGTDRGEDEDIPRSLNGSLVASSPDNDSHHKPAFNPGRPQTANQRLKELSKKRQFNG